MAGKSELELPPLSTKAMAPPSGRVARWLFAGGRIDEAAHQAEGHEWYQVLWLTGVDYFSTLGYQPGIALLAAGVLSPVATVILVAVTLFGALPVYAQVARRSYAGQGSIAMLENLLPGWSGKILVLILLGFASTDFVITMTLSAADAAQHAIENPLLHPLLGDTRLLLTMSSLAVLALVFIIGFSEAIGLAALIAIPYILLNIVVLARAAMEVLRHPELLNGWQIDLAAHGDWTMLMIAAGLIFPKLALGMSGFETGVSVMPQVAGGKGAAPGEAPLGRIRATQKLLASAALIMSALLVASSFLTTVLIPEHDYAIGGPASGRALAYLAHKLLGTFFGTIYDISTIAILWFAGASAMAGMLNLIPRYLPRYGMAPRWVAYARPLVVVLFLADVVVTWAFDASVEAQGGAYATGVLVLMLSAAIAVSLALWHESSVAASPRAIGTKLLSASFWLISLVFAYTLVDNVIERTDGVIIASVFIVVILVLSAASRYLRSTELRVEHMTFVDAESKELWPLVRGKKVHLVPLKTAAADDRERKRREIQKHYNVRGPFAFVHVHLLDNRSDFLSPLHLKIRRHDDDFILDIYGANAVANSLAYLSEQIDPKSLFLGLTRQNLMTQSLKYLLWGEGEVGISVYTILIRYWDWTPEDDVRPRIFLMSE
ncbi:MAG: hypothetical protein HYX75_18385 [Acidobacteria bacterium]|nr:hypothetical protein [Acidobacteriota bacterium]